MFKLLYKTNNKKKNKEVVNMIRSGLSDLESEIENIDEEEKKLKIQMKYQTLLKKFLSLITKYNQEKE